MASKLKLDSGGIAEMLLSAAVSSVVTELAHKIGDSIDETARNGDAIPVKVFTGRSDRARATVTLAHPAGLALEAKHGALTKAAKAAGLEVRSKGAA